MKKASLKCFYQFLLMYWYAIHLSIGATDTITATHFLKDGDANITSAGETFEMGFFSPGNSKLRYVGIWYKNISVRTVVWVANREAPLTSGSGILKVIEPGLLVLLNGTDNVIWSTNTSRSVQNPIAQLLDSGNLVVKEAGGGNFLWQSFDHLADTLLPGMKLGWNFVTGREVYLSSWKNKEDPAPGDFTYHCDPSGYPQNFLKKVKDVVYRSGPWNGLRFSGATSSRDSPFYTFGMFSSETEVYFTYKLLSSVITRLILNHNGDLQRWTWGDRKQDWGPYLSIPTDNCDVYKLCGAYGSCNSVNSPVCGCLDKFVPKHKKVGKRQTDSQEKSNRKIRKVLFWILPLSVGVILVILSVLICQRRRKKTLNIIKKGKCGRNGNFKMDYNSGSCTEEFEIPLFDLSTITKATDNFSTKRKIGEGGFGPVYKGILEQGQEVAVKRLSKTSAQGEDEFKNEVVYIAKLQHRNLVKILGCCIEGEEKMLILEYLPNGSLDSFIFGDRQSRELDWPKRFHIINGIARGLVYLHQDSPLKIIHRDLKANNILLDNDMNPKISDFGIARISEEDKIGAMTNRVMGTYGYLSPEYALHGEYSVKSDVFSFGILVLEIVSGKSNRRFSPPDLNLNLLGYAWELYKEGRSIELLDERLGDSCLTPEVERSIRVGLLCVQQHPEDRPSMSSVVLMLNNEGPLPRVKQPGFYVEEHADVELFSSQFAHTTTDEIPITI
ncbi:g-type lectin s-receptor-like serinethreonine-protein kinase sd1-1 [Nicotiana attenuata]|uniref:Receptor-like serine/threonine-protein kinase n=1 Tax=Nicotiana attenuata TaxID=49451 RepID=A0A314L1N2_NICAT|nr:g-type lectin s-receptor-like serinethreonine-protein kinase sd1-1 [Nicotiana attenuata]